MPLAVLVLLAHAAANQPVSVQTSTAGLVLEPVISELRYCKESSGVLTLRLRLMLHYRNHEDAAIVLPVFALLTRYELFAAEAALDDRLAEADIKWQIKDIIDPHKLDQSQPDPKLFRVIQPGETTSAYTSVSIALRSSTETGSWLMGKDHYLRVHMNPWPAGRKAGKRLASSWQRFGRLQLVDVVSFPIKLHIEHRPYEENCAIRID